MGSVILTVTILLLNVILGDCYNIGLGRADVTGPAATGVSFRPLPLLDDHDHDHAHAHGNAHGGQDARKDMSLRRVKVSR